MKNPVIFGLSNVTIFFRSGQEMLASHKAGIFYFPSGVKAIVTCRAWSIMGHATPSERVAFDSGKGQSLFCCPGIYQTPHHATSRNHPARTAANTTHTFSAPPTHPKQDGPATFQNGIRVSPANGAPETTNRNDGAGQLPASITFAAIPPAAFFHTTFFNLACSVEGRIA